MPDGIRHAARKSRERDLIMKELAVMKGDDHMLTLLLLFLLAGGFFRFVFRAGTGFLIVLAVLFIGFLILKMVIFLLPLLLIMGIVFLIVRSAGARAV